MSRQTRWTLMLLTLMLAGWEWAWAEGTVVGTTFPVTWTASPSPNLKEYRIYVTKSPGVYDRTRYVAIPAPATSADGAALTLQTDGQYYLVMTAVSLSAAAGESVDSNEVPFVRQTFVPLPTPDVTPPVIAIRTPVDGGSVPRNTVLPITVDASDNVGITRLALTVNGQSLCILFAPPWVCPWPIPRAGGVRYTINALAIDASGNNAQSQIEVVAK